MRFSTIYIVLILMLAVHHNGISLSLSAAQYAEPEEVVQNLEQRCMSYTFVMIKPLLEHIEKINTLLGNSEMKDNEIQDLKRKLDQKEQGLTLCHSEKKDMVTKDSKETFDQGNFDNLTSQISFLQATVDSLFAQLSTMKNFGQLQIELAKNSENLKKCELHLSSLTDSYTKKEEEIKSLNESFDTQLSDSRKKHLETEESLKQCKSEMYKLSTPNDDPVPDSCVPFKGASHVHKIAICKLGEINVLCDSRTVGDGDGWIVIQQRINGKTNFYEDWNAYRNGFGSLDGDFFIGLEKLHRLTANQRQELYIHMKSFDGEINYARYDNFRVGSEKESYPLSSLGEFFSENLNDMLRWHENEKFTTFDRENDNWPDGNCAEEARGGWWYKACASSNLNGEYFDAPKTGSQTIYWAHYVALKEVKMLIRPKRD